MKYSGIWRFEAALSGAALLTVVLLASTPASAQDTAGKKFCVGCSADGKTTPRTADGHPDLSGMWVGGFGGATPNAAPAEDLAKKLLRLPRLRRPSAQRFKNIRMVQSFLTLGLRTTMRMEREEFVDLWINPANFLTSRLTRPST
jgi:hypothetical protein